MPARSCVTPGSCPRSSVPGSCFLATISSTTTCRTDRARRLPLHLAPARRSPRRAVAARAPAPRHPDPAPGIPDARAAAHAGGARLHRVHPHGGHRGDGDRAGADRGDPRRDLDHRRPRRRLGARRLRRHVSILVNQNDCRTNDLAQLRRPRPGRSPLAAVLRRDLVPDGLRDARRRQARAVRGEGRRAVRQGDALRRERRCPVRRAERRSAGVPRRASCSPST